MEVARATLEGGPEAILVEDPGVLVVAETHFKARVV